MLVSAVWIAPAVLATISRGVGARLDGEPAVSVRELLWAGGDWLVYAVLTPPIFALSRRWPIARPHIARRALLHLLFAWSSASPGRHSARCCSFCWRSPLRRPKSTPAWPRTARILAEDDVGSDRLDLRHAPFGVVVYLSIVGIAHAVRYFVEARDREVQFARLSEQLTGARLAALQAQLNPHFLFNSLNTITSSCATATPRRPRA